MFSPLLVEPQRSHPAARRGSASMPRRIAPLNERAHSGCACGGGCPRCGASLREARTADVLTGRTDVENPRDSHPNEGPIPLDAPARNRAPADDAADCSNGGGSSFCNPQTGNYDIDPTVNTCCTRECTELHEKEHVKDMDGWGCCKDLSQRVVPAAQNGGDPKCFVDTFQKWLDIVTPLTECHAYTVSVNCADRLARERGCNTDAGRRTNCCKNIKQYRDAMEAKRKENCDRAPKRAPPCPQYHCATTAPKPAPPPPKPARPSPPAH